MHWYFQLSSLVFIPFPALPSSLFMPCKPLPWATAQSKWICLWAKAFSYMGKKCWKLGCVFMRLHRCSPRHNERGASSPGGSGKCFGCWGKFPVEVLWISYGGPMKFLWRSSEFPMEVLWSSCGGPVKFLCRSHTVSGCCGFQPCFVHQFSQLFRSTVQTQC